MGLGLLTHAMTSRTAAWPGSASIIITGTVSYLAARHQRR
jgi:hypothetical protein